MIELPEFLVPGVTTGHVAHHVELHDIHNAAGNVHHVMSDDYGAVHGGSAATNTAALNAARAAIVASGKPGVIIIPPGVDLPITPGAVVGAADVAYGGGGTLSTTQTTAGSMITFPAGSARGEVRGLVFKSPNNQVVAVASADCDDVVVEGCRMFGPRIWVGGTGVYAANTNLNATTNARITGNLAVANVSTLAAACIWAYYVRGGVIAQNIIIGHAHGIEGWGGDANPDNDGDLANERKATSLTVTGNIVMNSTGSGIWFSMCRGVAVTGNAVVGCGDVGIDFEGCMDATASGNTCADNVGGNFTTFFHGEAIVFSGNTGYWSTQGVMVRCANFTGYPLQMDVEFIGNTFRAKDGISLVGIEPVGSLTFAWNKCVNVRLDAKYNNQGDTAVENNRFRFSESMSVLAPADRCAIRVGQNHDNPRVSICSNKVRSMVEQPAGSYAISVEMDDPVSYPIVTIDHNDTPGWGELPIRVVHSGATSGVYCLTHVGWNNLGEGTGIDRVESGTSKSVMLREGNKQHGIYPIPGAIPGSGYWDVGEEAVLVAAAGGKRKAVCTVAGTPGTWKNWGPIDA